MNPIAWRIQASRTRGRSGAIRPGRGLRRGTGCALLLAVSLLAACSGTPPLVPPDAGTDHSHLLLDAPHPGRPGPYTVRYLTYGSGTDRRRPEFRDSVAFTTPTVDASPFIDLGDDARRRNAYWGFSPEAFPLNGRVWAPEGEGPFPLVLIVHGNHNPRDFSDPGYGYLGRLLASRGFLTVSVDMNFVNGGIREENDARGWLLLKHLEAWRAFNATAAHPFYGKVDLDRVALIGHSRGGEAVAHAAAFNRLTHYPDDATVTFDFGFGIQSLVAIAPVDGQYMPTGRYVPLENVNYMVFHGSHDGDVSSFHGLRQYHRVAFTDGSPRFKTAIYVYRANHGQWNTVWNNKDNGPRSGRSLDLDALIPPEDQRAFAELYVSAFLEATLHGDARYLPLFRDHRLIGRWLPPTRYVTRLQTSAFHPLATFEEDIDVTTGTVAGVRLAGDSLATWREDRLDLRSRNRSTTSGSQLNQAAWLGWAGRAPAAADSTPRPRARYTVTLPDTLASRWGVDASWTLDFLLAPTRTVPRSTHRDTDLEDDASPDADEPSDAPSDEKEPADDLVTLTVEVTDASGEAARLPLHRYGRPHKPLEIHLLRRSRWEKQRFDRQWELILQSYSMPLSDFAQANPSFDPSMLRLIRFVFDQTPAGTVVLDDIGLSALDPAFTRVTLPPSE